MATLGARLAFVTTGSVGLVTAGLAASVVLRPVDDEVRPTASAGERARAGY